jgi:16S rRNA (guanine966-N2)-methyltransferase
VSRKVALPHFSCQHTATRKKKDDTVRIVAGKYKRRSLVTLPGTDITRPTSDRARESLFNILAPILPGARILDLFAGSGALGIEALSRGAQHVVFVEAHREAFHCLKKNLDTLKIPSSDYSLFLCSVQDFLNQKFRKTLARWNEEEFAASMNLVIADPPYALSWYDHSMENLEGSGLCTDECLTVIEMSSRSPASIQKIPHWNRVDERTYGAARLEFWQRTDTEFNHDEVSAPQSP